MRGAPTGVQGREPRACTRSGLHAGMGPVTERGEGIPMSNRTTQPSAEWARRVSNTDAGRALLDAVDPTDCFRVDELDRLEAALARVYDAEIRPLVEALRRMERCARRMMAPRTDGTAAGAVRAIADDARAALARAEGRA